MMLISILSGSVFALPIPTQGKRHPCWNVPKNKDSFCNGKSDQEVCLKGVKRNRVLCFREHRRRQMIDPYGHGANTAPKCFAAFHKAQVKCRTSRGLYQGTSYSTCLKEAEGIKKTCLSKFADAKDITTNQLSKAYHVEYFPDVKAGETVAACSKKGGTCTTRDGCPRTEGKIQRIGFCPGLSNIRCCLNAEENSLTLKDDQPATL
jgi:hypothetical protein